MADMKEKCAKAVFGQNLTKRELEICGLIAKGLSSGQIAKLLYISEGTVKNHITSIFEKTGVKNRTQLAAAYVAQCESAETDMTGSPAAYVQADENLRLVGLAGLPDTIPLIFTGPSFVIGRFDISVGRKQCDFEFAKSTKAVSRRHAAIERAEQGTVIIDLHSRAGVFVNGNRLTPGEPYPLNHGDRISFGNAGADYVFE